MKSRCLNPDHKSFPSYGGRGIKICPQWIDSFKQFMADVGPRPSPLHSIDRIDNNGDYEPGNCRWATRSQQQRNMRSNRRVLFEGEFLTIADVAERVGRPYNRVRYEVLRGLTGQKVVL